MDAAKEMFMGTNIKFTTEGKRHLGATIGSENFRTVYAIEKVQEWCEEVKKLSKYAKTQPQAAFAAFCHGEQHRFSYFMRTIPGMEKFMEPLDETIHNIFLPSLFDSIITEDERLLFSLPIRLGGLGIPKFTEEAEFKYKASTTITSPLVAIMVLQGETLPNDSEIIRIKSEVTQRRNTDILLKADQVERNLEPNVLRAVQHSKEKGASNWLSTIPLADQGFTLNKGEFRDAISL